MKAVWSFQMQVWLPFYITFMNQARVQQRIWPWFEGIHHIVEHGEQVTSKTITTVLWVQLQLWSQSVKSLLFGCWWFHVDVISWYDPVCSLFLSPKLGNPTWVAEGRVHNSWFTCINFLPRDWKTPDLSLPPQWFCRMTPVYVTSEFLGRSAWYKNVSIFQQDTALS